MCKKLIFVLAMVMLAVPASAQMQYPQDVVLKVDIDGNYDPCASPSRTQEGWYSWPFTNAYSGEPITSIKNFDGIVVQMKGVRADGGQPDSRMRGDQPSDGLGDMHQDLIYIPKSDPCIGLGHDYFEFKFLAGLRPDQDYEFTFWGWDSAFNPNNDTRGTDWNAWGIVNPSTYPDYAPGDDANKPPMLARAPVYGEPYPGVPFDEYYDMTYSASFIVHTDGNGRATMYGWQDPDAFEGSFHMPVNGFAVAIPEPATVALLGLGGLALLRRRRR